MIAHMQSVETSCPELEQAQSSDRIFIRGRSLDLNDLFRPMHFDPATIQSLAIRTQNAIPFAHLNVAEWFNPVLLELILEEFSLYSPEDIQPIRSRHEVTYRSVPGLKMGPATRLYFDIVNSGPFVNLLSQITGIPNLLPDPSLHGGGLHETRNGGKFKIHRDFDRHPRTGLENRLVFITYLNKAWQPEWNGALELWDEDAKACVVKIEPEFGCSLIMCNGHHNFHGHPNTLDVPEGRSRRSIAAYYYTNTEDGNAYNPRLGSVFLLRDSLDKFKDIAREVVPSSIWNWMKKRVNSLY